jgi:hypothetical protein
MSISFLKHRWSTFAARLPLLLPEPFHRVHCLCVLQAHLRFGLSTSSVGVAAVVYLFAAATCSLVDTPPSSQRLPGRWRILLFFFAAATWSLVDIVTFSFTAAT